VARISLGGDILKFFCKTVEGPKIYIQIMLLMCESDTQAWEDKLWGPKVNLQSLHKAWQDWKATVAKI
jgi:hypothetical protein